MKTDLTPLLVLDHITKISSINEKTKTLEIDIKMRGQLNFPEQLQLFVGFKIMQDEQYTELIY